MIIWWLTVHLLIIIWRFLLIIIWSFYDIHIIRKHHNDYLLIILWTSHDLLINWRSSRENLKNFCRSSYDHLWASGYQKNAILDGWSTKAKSVFWMGLKIWAGLCWEHLTDNLLLSNCWFSDDHQIIIWR